MMDQKQLEEINASKKIAEMAKEIHASAENICAENDRLKADNSAKDQQIATLKRALKIAAELYNKATGDGWSASDETAEDFIFMAEHPEQAKEQEGAKGE
jgi:hypothetical protein